MKFNKGLALILGLISGSVSAASGTITFTGNILDTGCSVDAGSQNQTVILPDVFASDFKNAGDKAAAKEFEIVITCPASHKATNITFDPTMGLSTDGSAMLSNHASVGINITTATDNTEVKFRQPQAVTLVDGQNTLRYVARYQALSSSVTAGALSAATTFTITYN